MRKLKLFAMLKIVIDTNVIVSALIGGSYPSRIIKDIVLDKKVIVCLSHEVFSEYVNVVNREKFKKYTSFVTNAEIVLNKIDQISLKFVPGFQLETIKDEADNRFLELALAANADFLVTGNTKDFTMKNIETLKIVAPEEFINAIKF